MHIILFFCLSLLISTAICVGANKWFKNTSKIKVAIVNFVAVYILFLLVIYCYDIYLEYRLGLFDLNGDGFFGGAENTPEKEKYMSLVVNDAGRALAPFTGFLFSFLYSLLLLSILKVHGCVRKR